MGRKRSDPYIRAQAVALYNAGYNQVDISKQLTVSQCCVQNAIKKYKQFGRYDDSKRSGRPKKIDKRSIRHLKRLVNGDSSSLCQENPIRFEQYLAKNSINDDSTSIS